MADKEVIINGFLLVHGKGVKESIEKSAAKSILCFDEAITTGAAAVSYKLDIDRLVFETREQYEDMRDILNELLSVPGTIQTRETIRFRAEEPFTIVKNYTDVILDGRDYEMKVDEMSAQSLSFVCGGMEEYTE